MKPPFCQKFDEAILPQLKYFHTELMAEGRVLWKTKPIAKLSENPVDKLCDTKAIANLN